MSILLCLSDEDSEQDVAFDFTYGYTIVTYLEFRTLASDYAEQHPAKDMCKFHIWYKLESSRVHDLDEKRKDYERLQDLYQVRLCYGSNIIGSLEYFSTNHLPLSL